MEAGPKKSNKSSVVIVPPEEIWPQIQKIRSVHDKSFARWMPHINLLYPFVEDDQNNKNFDYAAGRMEDLVKRNQFKSFAVIFNKESLNYFEHRSHCTLWLKPFGETGELNADILRLQQLLQEEFPDFDDLDKVSEGGFKPHLSLGQFSRGKIENEKSLIKDSWDTLKFTVNEVCIISRKNFESPFEVRHKIKLL